MQFSNKTKHGFVKFFFVTYIIPIYLYNNGNNISLFTINISKTYGLETNIQVKTNSLWLSHNIRYCDGDKTRVQWITKWEVLIKTKQVATGYSICDFFTNLGPSSGSYFCLNKIYTSKWKSIVVFLFLF